MASRTYAELHAAALAGARELAGPRRGGGATRRDRAAAGLDFAQALHACLLLGAVAVPVDLRLGAAERERCICDGAALIVEEPLSEASSTRTRGGRPACPRRRAIAHAEPVHDLDAVGRRDPHLRHERRAEAGGADLRQPPVERARLGRRARPRPQRALAVRAAALPRRRPLDPACARAIYATTAVVHERFETDRGAGGAARAGDHARVASSPRRSRGCSTPGSSDRRALRCALTGGGPVPAALLARARAAGVPVSHTYGLTEACSQVSDRRPVAAVLHAGAHRRCSAPAWAGRTGRSWSRARPWRLAARDARRLAAHRRSRRARRARPPARRPDASADTIVSGGENVAPAEVEAVLEAHPDVLEAAVLGPSRRALGRGRHRDRRGRAPAASSTAEELRAHCAARLARYKVPKQIGSRRAAAADASGKLLRRELA